MVHNTPVEGWAAEAVGQITLQLLLVPPPIDRAIPVCARWRQRITCRGHWVWVSVAGELGLITGSNTGKCSCKCRSNRRRCDVASKNRLHEAGEQDEEREPPVLCVIAVCLTGHHLEFVRVWPRAGKAKPHLVLSAVYCLCSQSLGLVWHLPYMVINSQASAHFKPTRMPP